MKKFYKNLMIPILLFCTMGLKAQQPAGNYAFSESTEAYSPVVGTVSTATGDDGSQNTITIPFTFKFEGVTYTNFSINTNGFIRLGNVIAASPWTNTLGNTATQRPLIAPFWDDNHRNTGSIQYAVSGVAPNRIFEIGWDSINIGGSGTTSSTLFASYKIRLNETTDVIEFIYGPTMANAGTLTASVGINGTATFLSVTPAASSTASNATANNGISATTNLVGKKFIFTPPAPPSCLMPTSLNVSALTASTASIGWTSSAGTWNIEFDTAGFTPTGTPTITGTTTNPHTLGGLSPNTSYQFYVQADCGGAGTSTWAGPFTFTTPCSVMAVPFTEGFEAASTSLSCWSQIQVVGTSNWTYATGAGGGGITTAQAGTRNARFVSMSGTNSPITKLVSPTFDLTTLTTPELSFYYGQEFWSPDQNRLKVYYRISSTDPWVEILHDSTNVATWTKKTILLPNPSATYQVAFEGINNYGRANVIDEVEIKEAPACIAPISLTVLNLTATSVDLGWTSSAGTWNIEWDTAGFTPMGTPTITGTMTNPHNLGSLSPNTSYQFYVQADCGGSGTSTWAGPFTFTTPCVAPVISSFPWTENFDGVSTPAIPCGWIVDNVNADAYTWVTGSNLANSAPNSMEVRWNSAQAANDWSFTPELVLVGGQTYELSFAYAVAGSSFPEKLKVMYGTAQNVAGMTTLLFDSTLTNTTYNTAYATFTPATSGSYFIGFHNYSDADMFRIYVDDVTLKEAVPCSLPSNLTAFNITQTSAMLDWTENGTATEWNIEWGFQGFTLGTGTPEHVTAKPYLLNGLMPATSYDYYVQADCGTDSSAWVGPYTFMTPPCMPIGLELGADTTLCSGQSLTLNAPTGGPYGWTWSTTESTPSITVDTASLGGNGTYNITINMIDFSTTCTYNDNINVTFTVCTGVNEITSAPSFTVYPNPTTGLFTVSTTHIEKATIEVINLQGKVVYKNNINSNNQVIDLRENAKGVYFVSITSTNGVDVLKIIVQ